MTKMTNRTKIIIASVVLIAIGTSVYFFLKKRKEKKNKIEKKSEDGLPDPNAYDPTKDERFGKGLGVLAIPKKPIPTTTTTTETNKPNASTPNFTKGIF